MNNLATTPILCIGFPAWEGNYQKSTVMLMEALAATQHVLYVEYPFTWKDVWMGWRHKNRPYKRILGLEDRLRTFHQSPEASLRVLTLPPALPINGLTPGTPYERLAQWNAYRALPTIKQALGKLGWQDYHLIYAFNPFLGVFLRHAFSPISTTYYCYDEIGAANWTQTHGAYLEQRLIPQMDGIFTSSRPLLEKKGANLPGLVVKNGVNVDLFSQAYTEQPPVHNPTTLGYIGSIDQRIDTELLFHTLEYWPEARLLMVGRISDARVGEKLGQHPRISLVGPKPPAELPTWIRQMDVGLIPFVHNEFTRFIYPLKINEYLAAGLPVISSRFGDLSDFEEIAYIADDFNAFAMACRQAVLTDSARLRSRRAAFAAEQSWAARADSLQQWLATLQAKEILHT